MVWSIVHIHSENKRRIVTDRFHDGRESLLGKGLVLDQHVVLRLAVGGAVRHVLPTVQVYAPCLAGVV